MNEISFGFLIAIFKKNWWKILTVTLVFMILVASFTHFFIAKKYSSSMKFYVLNANETVDYTSVSILGASSYLINDYFEIINSDPLLDQVRSELEKKEIYIENNDDIRKMLKYSTASSETSVFTLSVSHTDKALAYKIATVIADVAPEILTKIARDTSLEGDQSFNIDSSCIKLLTVPTEAKTHDSPNLPLYTLVGGVLAAIAAYGCFLIHSVLVSNITSEEDIKKMTELPLLGVIPRWDSKALRSQEKGE